jgi:PleD family two-component response regulator
MHLISDNIDDFSLDNRNLARPWWSTRTDHRQHPAAGKPEETGTQDTLTGLYNRRFLLEFFETELSRAIRRSQQLSFSCLISTTSRS